MTNKGMMEEKGKKFLIVTSATGGGHMSAAQALEEGFRHFGAPECLVNVVRAIEDSHLFAKKMADLYNYLLCRHQHLMKYYYWAIDHFRPNESSLFFRLTAKYGRQLFEKYCPQVVVSVHPMVQHFLAAVLRDLGLLDRIPLVTIVTDPYYGFWRGWACDDVSLYIVATEEAKQQLIDYGVATEKIKIFGMPIHPKFQYENEDKKIAARLELGLDPEKFTVFINAGWVGGGNVPNIFQSMLDHDGQLKDTQAIFLAGRNEGLRSRIESASRYSAFQTKVIGYSDAMEKLMCAADVMVSKLGGLTTFEALASRLPIIGDAITKPMPQELQTAQMIARHNAGLMLSKATDIVPTIRRLLYNPEEHEAMKRAATILAVPDSTKRIVAELSSV